MKFIKESTRPNPKISLILLDWSVRESFHLLHYLSLQNVPRDSFEVIVIEYYSRISEAVRRFANEVDTWVLLEIPQECYYHKHLMYNAGIVLSRGEVCVFCDSDAMVKAGFIRAILDAYETNPDTVLHIDQFRNVRREFYPFSYPSFEEVTGEGCINSRNGQTTGLLDKEDPLHTRNYGACMCARKADLIAIGGADEHIDYLGHICGPYDMTFRLMNSGRRERWHETEFMYHTWHPGQAGVNNYLGPHDGRHMSTTSLTALRTGRRLPYLENPAIEQLRSGITADPGRLYGVLVDRIRVGDWRCKRLRRGHVGSTAKASWDRTEYLGFLVERDAAQRYHAQLLAHYLDSRIVWDRFHFEAASAEEASRRVRRTTPFSVRVLLTLVGVCVCMEQIAAHASAMLRRRLRMTTGRRLGTTT